MNLNITIAGHNYSVEFEYKITAHSTPSSWTDPGDPAEWEIEGAIALKADGHGDDKETELEVPKWLCDVIIQAICDDEAVNDKIQQSDCEDDRDYTD